LQLREEAHDAIAMGEPFRIEPVGLGAQEGPQRRAHVDACPGRHLQKAPSRGKSPPGLPRVEHVALAADAAAEGGLSAPAAHRPNELRRQNCRVHLSVLHASAYSRQDK
jgi:hypothetical protein